MINPQRRANNALEVTQLSGPDQRTPFRRVSRRIGKGTW